MAVLELTSFSNGTTGNTTVNFTGTETPQFIDFWVGPRSGTTEAAALRSTGSVDITQSIATWQSDLADATHFQTKSGAGAATGVCLTHYAIVAGVITKVIEMKYVSCAAGSFTVNLTTANSSYPIYARVHG